MKPTRNIAVILMAGSSERIPDLEEPKQYYQINKRPLYLYTLQVFENNPKIDEILVVANREYLARTRSEIDKAHFHKVKNVISGGRSRTESAYMALEFLNETYNDREKYIIMHDGVRPFITPEIISEHIEKQSPKAVVCTVVPEYDSVIEKNKKGTKLKYLDRNSLIRMQTPQSFYLNQEVLFAYSAAFLKKLPVTDDYGILKGLGYRIKYVDGSTSNFKITTKNDLLMAENLLSKSKTTITYSPIEEKVEKKVEEPVKEESKDKTKSIASLEENNDYQPVFATQKEAEEKTAAKLEEKETSKEANPEDNSDEEQKEAPKITRVIKPLGDFSKPTAQDYEINPEDEYELHPNGNDDN